MEQIYRQKFFGALARLRMRIISHAHFSKEEFFAQQIENVSLNI
jgi:hypothetical protein